jgi:hypothetical protein
MASRIVPTYENIHKTHGARVCIVWDLENVRCPGTLWSDRNGPCTVNNTLTALKRAFTLNGKRKLDDIVVVHKQRTAEVRLP